MVAGVNEIYIDTHNIQWRSQDLISGGGKIYIHYACILEHTHITYMLDSCKGIFIFLSFFLVKIPLINENIFSN